MTSRILVIPPSFFSPRVMEAVPAGRVFVSQLRRSFSVDIFDWPWSRQRPTAAPPWPSPLEATAAAIDPICHVIALGGGGTAALRAAAANPALVKSIVFEGLILPAATLRALGLDRLADANSVATAPMQRGWGGGVMRVIMPVAAEREVAELGDMLESDMDWAAFIASSQAFDMVNLLEDKSRLPMPTLFLEGQIPVPGYGAGREWLRDIAPQTAFGKLELWPARADLPEAGHELAERVSEFIRSIDP